MGLFSSLFGGSKSSSGGESESTGWSESSGNSSSLNSSRSTSGNKAFGMLDGILSPTVSAGAAGVQQGLGELAGGFDDYKNKAGFNFLMDRGLNDITSNAAAKGVLNSGGTMKGLTKFAMNLGDTFYGNFLDKLGQFSELGMQAANPLVGAGSFSDASSSGSSQSSNMSRAEDISTSSQWAKGKDKGKGILGTLGSLF